MTVFTDHFAATGGGLLDDVHGEQVTRHPAGGGADQALTARWSPGEILLGFYADGSQVVAAGVLRAWPANLPVWSLNDEFTVRGVKWSVLQAGAVEPAVELQLGRRTSDRVGGDGHFQRR